MTQNETFISIQHLQYIMWRHIWYKELPLVFCAHKDDAEVWIFPEEIHIKTSGTLSTRTIRGALVIEMEGTPGGCSITHNPQYMVLKVKRGVTDGNDNDNEEVGV